MDDSMNLPAFTLDRAAILERVGDDEEIFAMMVDMYLQDVDSNCALLTDALAAGDLSALQREAHTVKGLLATFSDEAGTAAAFALEQALRAGQAVDAATAVAGLVARLREVAAVLKQA